MSLHVLQLYNQYRSLHGGEETVVLMTDELIKRRGGKARLLMRSSRGLDESTLGKAKAFAGAFYNRSAFREVAKALADDRPDLVHVHNLYPLFSPSVLVACRRAGVPVVMSNHNYVLSCPTTHHLRKGSVCEKCAGGKDYWCALTNCRENWPESFAYAARSAFARQLGLFRKNVNAYIVLTDFAKRRLIQEGYDAERIFTLPNMVDLGTGPVDAAGGRYVAFSGRMSREKGVDVLLEAARRCPNVSFKLAGHGPLLESLQAEAPPNCEFLGKLEGTQMPDFYRGSRMTVMASRWYEGCPLVVSEAMSHGIPLIVPRIGGLPELVREGETGRNFAAGDAAELAECIQAMWDDPQHCSKLGEAGRRQAETEYSENAYYEKLMEVYRAAMGPLK
ncbi:MAG: glycosyltransferase [Planctomycetales bacterium]|nr:glycosyltransferase [Planctomycetales bacterium]